MENRILLLEDDLGLSEGLRYSLKKNGLRKLLSIQLF